MSGQSDRAAAYDAEVAQARREFAEHRRGAGSDETRAKLREWHRKRLRKLRLRHGMQDADAD